MILKVMRSLKDQKSQREGEEELSPSPWRGRRFAAKRPQSREGAEGQEGSSSLWTNTAAGGGPGPLSGCQPVDLGCCSLFQPKTVPQGHFYPLLEDSKARKPLVAMAARAEDSLCKHSFALLFSCFFWFYLTDLLKKQRGNTNDMFNTDQLMALQHPKEHKYHIITSPQRGLRTKALCRSLWRGAVCHGSPRSPPTAPLGTKPLKCPPAMAVQQTLNGHEFIQPGGPGGCFTGGRSCLGLVKAPWAGASSAADKLHPPFTLVGCDGKMASPSKWLGPPF